MIRIQNYHRSLELRDRGPREPWLDSESAPVIDPVRQNAIQYLAHNRHHGSRLRKHPLETLVDAFASILPHERGVWTGQETCMVDDARAWDFDAIQKKSDRTTRFGFNNPVSFIRPVYSIL